MHVLYMQFLILSHEETRDSKSIILISINGKNIIVIYSERTRLVVSKMVVFFKNIKDCHLIYYLELGVSYILKILSQNPTMFSVHLK